MRPRRPSSPGSERRRSRSDTSRGVGSMGTWMRRPSAVTTTATLRRLPASKKPNIRSPGPSWPQAFPAETGSLAGFEISSTGVGGTPSHRTNGCVRAPPRRGDDTSVFILYAVVVGLLIGLLTGGSVTRLGELRFRWAPLIVLGMVAQVLLFSTSVGDSLGRRRTVAYVASSVAVLAAVFRNVSIPGLAVVLPGGSANLLAITANGGIHAGKRRRRRRARPKLPPEGYSNSRLVDAVMLGPLTDLFAMPGWVPSRTCSASATCSSRSAARSRSSPPCTAEARSKHSRTLRRPRPTSLLRHPLRPLVRLCTDPPFGRTVPSGAWCHRTGRTTLISRAKSALRWPPSRANPSRGGEQSQGLLVRRPPGCRSHRGSSTERGATVSDPCALHHGVVAAGDDRPDTGRGSQVELALKGSFVAPAMTPKMTAQRPGPVAGMRWD